MRRVDDMDTGDLLNHLRYLRTALALLCIASVTGHARVFLQLDTRGDVVNSLKRLGGAVAYASRIRLNDSQARLTVLGFDNALGHAGTRICQILALPRHSSGSRQSSLYLLRGDHNTLRLLLLNLDASRQLLAIAIEQSNDAFKASQTPPAQHPLDVAPPYPGSRPTFYAENRDTQLRFAVSAVDAPASAIRHFYDQKLQADGWSPSLAGGPGHMPKMPLYHRGRELCCILVTPAVTDHTQQITILHKTLGQTTN